MQVTNPGQEVRNFTEGAVNVDLLKVSLGSNLRVLEVPFIWSFEYHSAALSHTFPLYDDPLSSIAPERN